MGRYVSRVWQPSDRSLGIPRRYRRSFKYQAYIPDPLFVHEVVLLSDDAAGDLAEAEQGIRHLNEVAPSTVSMESVARLLLRAESVGSSRIEQLEVGEKRLLLAEAARAEGKPAGDVTAEAVIGNIAAMQYAVEELAAKPRITVEDLLEAHRRLMAHTKQSHWGGVIREQQNWMGGTSYSPAGAAYVPPPWEEVPALLADLADYVSEERHSPLVQAALAHAQFENIHPFLDGNGRIGRTLIHVVLKRRGLAPHYVPPISLVLATRLEDYVAGLNASRYAGSPTDIDAIMGTALWVQIFASAAARASRDAEMFSARIDEIVERWRQQVSPIRARSAVDLLLPVLPVAPILTVKTASELIGRSIQATNEAVARLTEAGVLVLVRNVKWGRPFEAVGLIEALTAFERTLATPGGDTSVEKPARRVPRRNEQKKY